VSTGAGTNAEESVQREWAAMIEHRAAAVLERAARLPGAPRTTGGSIGFGQGWAQAMDDIPWSGNDVLVVGSSQIGPVARVFLGSRATKIVRHAPVPVVVVPK
jgi:nucleotide-binding universal stress UspA family protein